MNCSAVDRALARNSSRYPSVCIQTQNPDNIRIHTRAHTVKHSICTDLHLLSRVQSHYHHHHHHPAQLNIIFCTLLSLSLSLRVVRDWAVGQRALAEIIYALSVYNFIPSRHIQRVHGIFFGLSRCRVDFRGCVFPAKYIYIYIVRIMPPLIAPARSKNKEEEDKEGRERESSSISSSGDGDGGGDGGIAHGCTREVMMLRGGQT